MIPGNVSIVYLVTYWHHHRED